MAHVPREILGYERLPRDGIDSYCHPEKNISLGLVEGLNNKIRVFQRQAYGYRDESYLKLKIVEAFLPSITRSAEKDPQRPSLNVTLLRFFLGVHIDFHEGEQLAKRYGIHFG
jgi:Transposase